MNSGYVRYRRLSPRNPCADRSKADIHEPCYSGSLRPCLATPGPRHLPLSLPAEVDVGAEPRRERREQLDGRLDVSQVDHLDRRVHVAERDRDEAGGDARAGNLHGVGVGTGAAPAGADRVLDALRLGGLDQQLEDLGGEGGAAADRGAGAERVATDLLLVDPGSVGRGGDVAGAGDAGPHLEGGGAGAQEADLLPPRGDGGERTSPA